MSSKNASSKQNSADGGKKQHVPKYIEADLNYLECLYEMDNKLDTSIYRLFNEHANSYWYALDLMSNTKDFSRGRSWSLSRAIMEAFVIWSFENKVEWQLTRESKVRALYTVLKQPNGSLIELVCDIFKMKEDSDFFKQFIKQFIVEKKFREVYYTVTALNLQREFSLSQVALPLFFLDKESWLKSYLNTFPELQLQLVTTLDSVCLNSQNVTDLIKSLNIDSIVKKHVYDTGWLQRRIAHFIDLFNLDITECPNLYYTRSAGAMCYLIRKKYIEETISSEPWEELITSIVADKPSLHKELVTRVVCFNDCEMALKLAKKFNVNENEWPASLLSFYHTSIKAPEDHTQNSRYEEHYADKKMSCLSMRLDMSDIHIVDNKEKFEHAIADIADNYDIIGVDAEWRPNLGISKERIALLQLAVWDAVYLLDILALKVCLKRDSWEYMMKSIFYNPDILKLGYGVHNDLRLLLKISGDDKAPNYSRIVDAGDFFTKVKELHPSIVDHITDVYESRDTHIEEQKGLSQLCVTLLGKPLNKNEQFSDWERRPLREEQILYAALDAYCLLLIYEKLFHILKKMELNFDDIAESPFLPNSSSEKKKSAKSPKKIQRQPTQITDFKVVVDSMLHGLGKYLRVCGADAVILRNDEDHMNCIKIAQADGRVILTSGTPFKKIQGYMPEDMCFYVPDTMPAKEQASFVLKNFNIQLSEADIFTRCTVCNGGHYLKVPSDDLNALWLKLGSSHQHVSVTTKTVELELKPFFIYEDGFITEEGFLHTAIPVQLHYLSPQVFQRVEFFFICSKCGKVYWEGSHFGRIKTYISNFVTLSEDERSNIYKVLSEKNEDFSNDQTIDPIPGCSITGTTKDSNLRTDDDIQDLASECTDESNVSKHKKTTMHFELETSDHSASDYDSDDLVYCD